MIPWIWQRLFKTRRSNVSARRVRNQLLSATSPEDVSGIVASALHANAIVVERIPGGFLVVAGSPWKPTLQALDRIAVDLCFRTGQPSGAGSDQSAGSDWLFVPVRKGDDAVAALGIAGRYCRRRFDPADALNQLAADALREIYSAGAPRPDASVDERVPA